MNNALTFLLTVLISFSGFAQQGMIVIKNPIQAKEDILHQKLVDMTIDENNPELDVIGSNMAQFYSLTKKPQLTALVNDFSGIDNDTIKSVLGNLKIKMDSMPGHMANKGRGLGAYSKTASNAFLTFIELYYRYEEKDNEDVPDFLFMFNQVGIPFMKQLREKLGLPDFNNPEICTKVIKPSLCKKFLPYS